MLCSERHFTLSVLNLLIQIYMHQFKNRTTRASGLHGPHSGLVGYMVPTQGLWVTRPPLRTCGLHGPHLGLHGPPGLVGYMIPHQGLWVTWPPLKTRTLPPEINNYLHLMLRQAISVSILKLSHFFSE